MLECKNLSFKYDNKIIFEDFNYKFENNEIYAIIGESGKGKTTLLRCLAGLNKPYKGQTIYSYNESNEVITKPSKNIFMMHQHYTNFPWKTCLENVLFPVSLKEKITNILEAKAKVLLIKVGLGDYIDKYPSELSGGMNQRLALVRTIMAEPNVILMDEPMSALDSETRKLMQDLLLELHNRTNNIIIMITHDNNEAIKMAKTNIIKF
jgi:ABC-type nitrate/sulfonate/bicarbonate transport system ATPase subunit